MTNDSEVLHDGGEYYQEGDDPLAVFLTVIHDIMMPLKIIRDYNDLLSKDNEHTVESLNYVTMVTDEADRMQSMIREAIKYINYKEAEQKQTSAGD